VALNCIANNKILQSCPIERLHIFPAAGDTGQSVGNALWYVNTYYPNKIQYNICSPYYGKSYNKKEIEDAINKYADKISWEYCSNVAKKAAESLYNSRIVFWFQGRSELGPRALGNRSILSDPRSKEIPTILNDKVKKREWYRPFAPSVLREKCMEYFDIDESPYMLLAVSVKEDKRDVIPAVVHVDNTARVQTVTKESNALFYDLISEFYILSGIPMVLNTSFNGKEEPIVETPDDAIVTFLNNEGDELFIHEYHIKKMEVTIESCL
jgi:carbamoyltransferase